MSELRHVKVVPADEPELYHVVTRRIGSVIGEQSMAAAKLPGTSRYLELEQADKLSEELELWITGQQKKRGATSAR